MKRLFPIVAILLTSCNADPHIVPEPGPLDASVNETTSSSSSSSSTSSTSSSSSASSSSGGEVQGDGSGNRIRRMVYTTADGLDAARSEFFYDTTLAAICVPRETPQGFRCAPIENALTAGYYGDAACATGVLLAPKTCTVTPYYQVTTSVLCGRTIGVKVFSVSIGAAQSAYYKAGGACSPIPTDQQANVNVYDIGPEVDYTQFAAMTLEHE